MGGRQRVSRRLGGWLGGGARGVGGREVCVHRGREGPLLTSACPSRPSPCPPRRRFRAQLWQLAALAALGMTGSMWADTTAMATNVRRAG